jgi:hypothetical protein
MARYSWSVSTLSFLIVVAALVTSARAADLPLGVVFTRPIGGATVSDTGLAVEFESFGGADPEGDAVVQRRFVLALDGTAVSDTTGTFPANHQESGFFLSLAALPDGAHQLEVSVFDEAGNSATQAIAINVVSAVPVVWTSAVKVAVAGNSITKDAGCEGCGDAGALSQQTIASGDGAVEFTVSPGAYMTVGLSAPDPGTGAGDIKFGVRFHPGNVVEVRESGVYQADWTYPTGATHRIAVEGGVVKYFLDGVLKHASTQAPSYPLVLDTSVWTLGAGVQNALIASAGGSGGGPVNPPPPPGQQPVVWTSAVNATVTGNTATKTGGCDGCFDAGATSQQIIASGSGSVSFTTPAGEFLVAGLSNGNPGTSGNEIAFGLRFYPGVPGIVEVREHGVYKWDWLNVPGALNTIAVDAGVVKYFQNGILMYTSATAPSLPLLLDTALGSSGSAVQNAMIGP